MNTKRWFVIDRRGGCKQHNCKGIDELYSLAFDISLRERAQVYFDEDATAEELIEDLRGCGCTVMEF